MVTQEHHSLLAQLVGDVHHFLCQRRHFPALEGHEVLELLGGDAVLIVVIALVDDVLGTELVPDLFLELFENVGRDRGGVAVPVHILLPLQLIKDQGELMEEGGVADHIDIRMVRDKLAQTLHGVLVGLGLTDVESDLVLKVLPIVGDRVVHMHRVPDQIGQEADGVLMEGLRLLQHHAARRPVVVPLASVQHPAGGAVDDLPPALDVVPGVDLHQLGVDTLHQGNGQLVRLGHVEARHDVALLHLIGVRLGPGVVLTRGVVGRVDLRVYALELFGIVGAVAVTDGIRAPALQKSQRFRDNVYVGGDGNKSPFGLIFTHESSS